MSPESLTGLLSWLEAAPPGVRILDRLAGVSGGVRHPD